MIQKKNIVSIFVLLIASIALTGCKDNSAQEELAKKQLQQEAEFQKKKEENLEKISNNTYNPFAPK